LHNNKDNGRSDLEKKTGQVGKLVMEIQARQQEVEAGTGGLKFSTHNNEETVVGKFGMGQ
jgi:hypothetical protein